jgi:hypothetical protein
MKVRVVTAYVPLNVKHLTPYQYRDLGTRMLNATRGRYHFFDQFPLSDCWLWKENPPLVPAAPTPSDRYETPADYARSNIVQHSRTQWALMAANEHPDCEVIVWLDYGILKQGHWNGKPITEHHIGVFLDRVERWVLQGHDADVCLTIPFPGIEEKKPIDVHGNNWRFCGSAHIWPVKYLRQIDACYKKKLRQFISCYDCTPLDLAIWPMVERDSGLPFEWYKADYDHTQLTEFPYA